MNSPRSHLNNQTTLKLLLCLNGKDRPGVSASIIALLVKYQAKILDMGQWVLYGRLSLSLLVETKVKGHEELLKELLLFAHDHGYTLHDELITDSERLEEQENKTPKSSTYDKGILSCVAQESINASFIAQVTDLLAKHEINIRAISNISSPKFRCLELHTQAPRHHDSTLISKELASICHKEQMDAVYIKDNIFRMNKRLVVFDMDSTFIQVEVIDELAKLKGEETYEEIKGITDKAMNGELNFSESLYARVKALTGIKVEDMNSIMNSLPITPGIDQLVKALRQLGAKVGIISGGFTFFSDPIKDQFHLDFAFANQLVIKNGKLTGELEGEIISPKKKALLLEMLARQEDISLEQVVAIGDGANDIPMLNRAGLGIAYRAKDIVKEKTKQNLSHTPMQSILYFLGVPLEQLS